MLHNWPVSKAFVAQVAQVVSVAPHLLLQFRIAHGRADHILVHCMGVLLQLTWKVTKMVMHLHNHTSAFTSLPATLDSSDKTQKSQESRYDSIVQRCAISGTILRLPGRAVMSKGLPSLFGRSLLKQCPTLICQRVLGRHSLPKLQDLAWIPHED